MRIYYLCFIQVLVWWGWSAAAAQNLVPNHSFEQYQTLPCKMISLPEQFEQALIAWKLPNYGTTDILSTVVDPTCYANSLGDLAFDMQKPRWGMGQKVPHSGKVMVGFFTYVPTSTNYREYVQVKLADTLRQGEQYYVECWVAHANFTHFASNNIGICLTTKPLRQDNAKVIRAQPMINEKQIIRTRFTEWYKIADTVIVPTDMLYLSIGNFGTDTETEVQNLDNELDTYDPNRGGAFYYLDDVGVWHIPKQYQTLRNEAVELSAPDTVSIFRNEKQQKNKSKRKNR